LQTLVNIFLVSVKVGFFGGEEIEIKRANGGALER
jgi:hypothetical protein